MDDGGALCLRRAPSGGLADVHAKSRRAPSSGLREVRDLGSRVKSATRDGNGNGRQGGELAGGWRRKLLLRRAERDARCTSSVLVCRTGREVGVVGLDEEVGHLEERDERETPRFFGNATSLRKLIFLEVG